MIKLADSSAPSSLVQFSENKQAVVFLVLDWESDLIMPRACRNENHYETDEHGRAFDFCPDCGKRLLA